jgi:creatinine amidohydrolase
MTERVLIEELSWTDVRDAIAAGRRTVLLACGAVEQHGPHLPTGTDTYLGTEIAARAARISGAALVAPTLRPGLSEHHMHFPGSFTLSTETFVGVLGDYLESLARHGFRRAVVFTSHGGNFDTMKAYTPILAKRLATRDCELVLSTAYPDFASILGHVGALGIPLGRAGVHAGWVETAMMLALAPELVDMSSAAPGRSDEDFYKPENVGRSQLESFVKGIQSQSENGILGDPTGADAAVGEELIQLAAEALARECLPVDL